MNLLRPLVAFRNAALLALLPGQLLAQCLNTIQYPPETIVVNGSGQVTQINNCTHEEEYSHVSGIFSGVTYEFRLGTLHYVTVRVGAFDGPVLGSGFAPLQVTATSNQDLFVHWNVDASCTTSSQCVVSSVRVIQNCTPPVFTYTTVNDCANDQFSIQVNVTSLGDAASVNVQYDSELGTTGTESGLGVGSHMVGPFADGDTVDIVVQHAGDPSCNVSRMDITNIPCPIVGCGPTTYNYCYHNNDTTYFVYQSSTSDPVLLQFISGHLYEQGGDLVTIYDGFDPSAPVLYSGFGSGGDLTGLQFVSTNPDHVLCLSFESDGTISCAEGTVSGDISYSVACLSCVGGSANFTPVTDCSTQSWSITVDVLDMGSGSYFQLTNNGGSDPVDVFGIGTYTTGPFALNTPVEVVLESIESPVCNIPSGPLMNGYCAVLSCGPDNYTFCYHDEMDTLQTYQSATTYPIAIQFNAGDVESCCDEFTIYDGLDETAPILYQGNNDGDMTGLILVSSGTNTSNALTLRFESDGSVSCADNDFDTQIDYTVRCLDCVPVVASYDVVLDCDNDQFRVAVHITSLGSDPAMDITNDGGAPPLLATAPGDYLVGPFANGTEVRVNVENDANSLCSSHSAVLTNSPCPVISCGPDEYTLCYGNNMDTVMVYQSENTYPIAMLFLQGTVESCCDDFTVYDGPNTTYPIIFEGNNGGDMSNVLIVSTNPANALTVVFQSDGSVSCASTEGYSELQYIVACRDCTPPGATYEVVPDCQNYQFFVQVVIDSLGSDPALDITNDGGAPAVLATAPGTYSVGPFVSGSQVHVSVENDHNSLCTSRSPLLTNYPCPFVSCGPDNYIRCYTDDWDSLAVYQSENNTPIALTFNGGRMESCCDRITVYDGLNDQATQIYSGNGNAGDMTGLLFVSSNPDRALAVQFHSDGSVNCEDDGYPPLDWTVQCLDCTQPEASFTVVPDCIHRAFSVAVNVSNTGSSPTVDIVSSYAGVGPLHNVGVGTTMVGPIPMDSTVQLRVLNPSSVLCRVISDVYGYDVDDCVIPSCAAAEYDYCYTNLDTAYFVYQSSESEPLTINFLWGQLLVNDYLQVFDGLDETAPMIYMGNEGGDMTGFAVNSTNPDNALTLRVVTSANGSCATGQAQTHLNWVIECGEVGIHGPVGAGDFAMYPNPTNGELNIRLPEGTQGLVDMRVIDVSGRLVHQRTINASLNAVNTFDLGMLQSGNYTVVLVSNEWVRARQLQLTR